MRFTKPDGFSRGERSGIDRPSTLLDFFVFLEPYKDVFHKLFRLCKISVVIPVSTASCERSFSALKLIKPHLRTTMADERLGHLGLVLNQGGHIVGLHNYGQNDNHDYFDQYCNHDY